MTRTTTVPTAPVPPADLTDEVAVEAFTADLLAFHAARFGEARMDDDDKDDDADPDDKDDDVDKDDDADPDDKDDEKEDDDKELGEAGQKALERIKARDKANRKRLRALTTENTRLKAAAASKKQPDDDAPTAEELREQAREEARTEIVRERVMDKIEAKAGGRFNLDPEDVAALLMRRHNVEDFLDENNKIDTDEIGEALDKLLADRPALAARGGKRFTGGADGGRRKSAEPKAKNLEEAISRKLSSSSR